MKCRWGEYNFALEYNLKCNLPHVGLKADCKENLIWTNKGLLGLEQFWVISLKTHNWVLKKYGTHTNFFVWFDFHIVFPSLKTQKFWVRVMETGNNKLVFLIIENWVSSGIFVKLSKEWDPPVWLVPSSNVSFQPVLLFVSSPSSFFFLLYRALSSH